MKELAIIALLLLLSACVRTQEIPPAEGELGVQETGTPGIEELPAGTAGADTGLLGEPVDLGSLT
jgi:hypothetical protein